MTTTTPRATTTRPTPARSTALAGRRRFQLLSARMALAAVLLAIAAGGCELIATADRSRIGGAGGGAGVGGSGGASCDVDLCPGIDTDCEKRACAGDSCTTAQEPAGTTCTDDDKPDAAVCDGMGSCVACVNASHCDGDELCVDTFCVPATCVNGALDDDESDVDCGGVCAPCENGKSCDDTNDCASGFCDDGTCAPCSPGGTDCEASSYCEGGTCVDKLDDGATCSDAAQCLSGFCPGQDGVCCTSACDGSCESCAAAKNGGAGNGTCAVVPGDTDPDGECSANPATCRAGGCNGSVSAPGCNVSANGTVCRAGSGDACDPSETCTGGVCPADTVASAATPCRIGSGDTCDPTEFCPGVPGMACPADVIVAAGQTCRPKNGFCDVADACTGTPGEPCPDEVAAQGSVGLPAPGCGTYACDGTSADCPPEVCDGDEDCAPGFTCKSGPNRCE